jgi:hypothetical protein
MDRFANPSKSVIVASVLLFPFILIGYAVHSLTRYIQLKLTMRRRKKFYGRDLTDLEKLTITLDHHLK